MTTRSRGLKLLNLATGNNAETVKDLSVMLGTGLQQPRSRFAAGNIKRLPSERSQTKVQKWLFKNHKRKLFVSPSKDGAASGNICVSKDIGIETSANSIHSISESPNDGVETVVNSAKVLAQTSPCLNGNVNNEAAGKHSMTGSGKCSPRLDVPSHVSEVLPHSPVVSPSLDTTLLSEGSIKLITVPAPDSNDLLVDLEDLSVDTPLSEDLLVPVASQHEPARNLSEVEDVLKQQAGLSSSSAVVESVQLVVNNGERPNTPAVTNFVPENDNDSQTDELAFNKISRPRFLQNKPSCKPIPEICGVSCQPTSPSKKRQKKSTAISTHETSIAFKNEINFTYKTPCLSKFSRKRSNSDSEVEGLQKSEDLCAPQKFICVKRKKVQVFPADGTPSPLTSPPKESILLSGSNSQHATDGVNALDNDAKRKLEFQMCSPLPAQPSSASGNICVSKDIGIETSANSIHSISESPNDGVETVVNSAKVLAQTSPCLNGNVNNEAAGKHSMTGSGKCSPRLDVPSHVSEVLPHSPVVSPSLDTTLLSEGSIKLITVPAPDSNDLFVDFGDLGVDFLLDEDLLVPVASQHEPASNLTEVEKSGLSNSSVVVESVQHAVDNEERPNTPPAVIDFVAENGGDDDSQIGATASNRISRPRTIQDKPTRKRLRDPSMWKSSVRKQLKNLGQEYVSSRGKIMECAKMRGPCACSLDCLHRLKEHERESIFKIFWQLGNHGRQWEFIRQNSTEKSTKNGSKLKKVQRTYFFVVKNVRITVCKEMFMRTLGICNSWIYSAYGHLNKQKGNTVSPDKRGGHGNRPTKTSEEMVLNVIEHVNSIPRVPSHYCRKSSQKEFLPHGWSLQKMARAYKEWAKAKRISAKETASRTNYIEITNRNFNLGFLKPKKDQCQLCRIVRENPRQVREKYKTMYASHILNKEKARKLKDKDKAAALQDRTIGVCSFDLQKQLECPKSESSELYYMTKLTVFNFTCFNMIKRMGYCYLWHEGIGKKGCSEISSCLLLFMKDLIDSGYNDLRFYSDNCAAQNKNRFLFAMYIYVAVKFSISITHRYLEPGHTQMEADSIHARIETSTARKDIYDYQDWINAIKNAKETLPKYEVKSLKTDDIFSFKNLVAMQNWDVDLAGRKIQWRKVREVSVNGKEGNMLRIRYDFDGELYTMSPNKRGRPVNLNTFSPPKAYDSRVPLKPTTIKHLQTMCDKLIIPLEKQDFIRSVIAEVDPIEEEEVSDIEYATDEEVCAGEIPDEEILESSTGEDAVNEEII